jgi:hypothetical protein
MYPITSSQASRPLAAARAAISLSASPPPAHLRPRQLFAKYHSCGLMKP